MRKTKPKALSNKIDLNISSAMKKRLAQKILDRNEDLILDKIEQMEMHRRAYIKLGKEVEELSKAEILGENI